LFALLTAGCAADGGSTPVETPDGCFANETLDGVAGAPVDFGPLVLGGANVCLRLDASKNLQSGHFAAGTDQQAGEASAFTLRLTDPAGTVLLDGWDVSVGQTDPRTFANLELSIPAGEIRDVILEVRAKGPQTATKITVQLFEPLE